MILGLILFGGCFVYLLAWVCEFCLWDDLIAFICLYCYFGYLFDWFV